jgi:DNA-binding NarL/FixJ family response regulator
VSERDVFVEDGRAALRVGDGPAARAAFERALAEADGGDVREGLARAAYLELDFGESVDQWERAYAAYRESGDALGAVRVARTLGYVCGAVLGDPAVMNGWIARAQTLLSDAPESSEWGWVALNRGMFEGDRALKEERFREALQVARDRNDTDLEFVTLAYLGASLVHADRAEEGMVLLDEACAAVAGHDVDNFNVLEEIFCQLFSACEHAHDVTRADQWIRIGESIAARRNLPAVSAFCHTHYGGVLTAAGRWSEADETLTEAVRLWALGAPTLRAGALIRLADLRVRQGRLEEAEQLLDGYEGWPEAARPMAAIHLAAGRAALARDVIERALADVDPTGSAAAPLLATLVDAHLTAGDIDAAEAAVDALVACASRHPSPYLDAAAALARGQVCVASGTGDPAGCLRAALAGFTRAQLPMELAGARLALAGALAGDRPEVAMAEARAALDGFERLQAARHADAAAAVLRSLGAPVPARGRSAGLLTKREEEVLDLLGHGLSNPEISDRLYISRKTVEHHVGNVLAKLGLRSRAEAAAYATRRKPAGG